MRLLITGGAGFIGSNLAALALRKQVAVTILDDLSTGSRANLDGLDVRLVEGKVQEHTDVSEALEEVDAVVHLGALPSVPRSIENPMATHQANATGTLTLLEACRERGISHATVASSSSVYGANPALPKSEREWLRPMSPYAVSKLATEQYALCYQDCFGFRTMAFRFFNVYGPAQPANHAYAAVIPAFVDALLAGRPLPMNGDGTQSRDFTFVGTVCRVLLEAATEGMSHPEPVNLAFGTRTSLTDLVGLLEKVTGLSAQIERRPARAGDVKHSQADNAVLRGLFPSIEPTSIMTGLSETVDWFKAQQ